MKLHDQPLTSPLILIALLDEFANMDNIHESYKPTINQQCSYSQLIQKIHNQKSLSPFLGDALNWLTGTANTRDTQEIKQCVNQLIQAQNKQQETLVHVISILNITGYASYVNRQKFNEVMDALQRPNEDLDRLFNISKVLTQCIKYQQMHIYMCTILAYLRDSLTYMRQVAIHMMHYVSAATTNMFSPDIL